MLNPRVIMNRAGISNADTTSSVGEFLELLVLRPQSITLLAPHAFMSRTLIGAYWLVTWNLYASTPQSIELHCSPSKTPLKS